MTNCIYIHIPFCEKKCNYCAFCSYKGLIGKDEYINSLIKEIKFHYENETFKSLKTIYFGGGTPSLLEISDFERILNCFNYNDTTEITLEANPTTLSCQNKIKNLKSLGFNRISIGVQSFDNDILKIIGRNHTRSEIYKAIENIYNTGFKNLSIDLIYGLPQQNLKHWETTLEEALNLNVEHISLYGLKIEKGTYFYKNPPKNIANSDIQADMYELAIEKLRKKYLHYEFSNFALDKNYISKHNSSYWKRENYWGFGLSASGFIQNKRYTNTFNLREYLNNPIEKKYQTLTTKNEIEEEIFLGLRLLEGIDFKSINEKYDIDIYRTYKKIFDRFLEDRFLIKTEKGVRLSIKGILVSNEILGEFLE